MNIGELLYEEESATLDFKEEQYSFINESNPHKKGELLKDILAFANAWRQSDAYILIGVREIKGAKSEVLGITEDIDDASLQQFVNQKLNRAIVFEYKTRTLDERKVAYIKIPVQKRPFFTKKDYGGVRKNIVYLRRGSSTDEANPDEISEMGEAKVKVEALSKNPANYKIVAKLTPVSINIDFEKESILEKIKNAEKDLKGINFDDEDDNFLIVLTHKASSLYNQELLHYKNDLLDYIKKYKNKIDSFKSDILNYTNNKYHCIFEVENIGNTSDLNIDITVNVSNGRLIEGYNILVYSKKIYDIKYPTKPSRRYDDLVPVVPTLPKTIDFSNNLHAYRRNIEITDNQINVVLRDMNVGDNVKLVSKKLFIDVEDIDLLKIETIIKSKESTSKIIKNVDIKMMDSSIDLYELFTKKK